MLVSQGFWPEQLFQAGRIEVWDGAGPAQSPYAEVRWSHVVAALLGGGLGGGDSDRRVLSIAASLPAAYRSTFRRRVRLDRRNLRLSLTALSRANGA